jgi:glycosyltransferase involved in cell wall biosynthesis
MNIALISDTFYPELNGVANSLYQIATTLSLDPSHSVHILTSSSVQRPEHHYTLQHLHITTCKAFSIPFYPEVRISLCFPSQVQSWLTQHQIEAIYIATESVLGFASINAAQKLNLKIVTGFHTNFHAYTRDYRLPWLQQLAQKYLYYFHKNSHHILTPSAEQVALLQQWGLAKATLLERGINQTLFSPEHRDIQWRHSNQIPEDALIVLYVGRLAPEKNLSLYFSTLKLIQEQHPNALGVLVGSGPIEHSLKEQHPNCLFLGPKRDIELARVYANADLFLFPSLSETFGNVILESMASGTVVMSYNYAAAKKFIQSQHNGFTAIYNDPQDFQKIALIAAQSTHSPAIRQAARESISHLSWSSISQEFIRFLS